MGVLFSIGLPLEHYACDVRATYRWTIRDLEVQGYQVAENAYLAGPEGVVD